MRKLYVRLSIVIALLFSLFVNELYAKKKVKTATIPFQYSQSLIFVRVKVNNKSGLLFLLNTGANTSVIDKSIAEKLKLSILDHDTVLGTAGKEPVQTLKIKTLQVGDETIKDLIISKRDLSGFVKVNNYKIDGILGTDFLKNFAITIDFGDRRIFLSRKAMKPGRQMYIPFEMDDNIPRFEARLNDTLSTYLRYNSGVSLNPNKDVYVNVSPSQWYQLKMANRQLNPVRYMTGTGVGGNVYLQVVSIDKLAFNGMEIKSPFIIVQPREGYFEKDEAIGFFGNNLLEKYYKVTIDFLNNRIVFNNVKKKELTP
ncbi:MAG TPA: retropepsin-like aspartic protease [Flavipsychrobacter sp.]|nr:retropepsin-like aspartic protease [Flavipsychrobacter sp.]